MSEIKEVGEQGLSRRDFVRNATWGAMGITAALGTLSLAGSLAGCSSDSNPSDSNPGDSSPSSRNTQGEKAGGELVHALTAIGDGWQQQQSNNWYKSQVWAQLVDTLVYVDDQGTIYPWLATSWEVSQDGLTYTIEIHKEVTFSDGTPLTAEVVAKNLIILGKGDADKGIARASLVPGEFEGAKATGEHTVEVTLSAPNTGFIASLGFFATGILGESTLDLGLEEQSNLENVVGSGPFVFESQKVGEQIVLAKRSDYAWPSYAFKHEGAAYLERIVFVASADDGPRLGALESGQVDSIHYVKASEELRLQDAGFNVIYGKYLGTPINFVIRENAVLVSDPNIRKAIQRGIDREEVVGTVYNENWVAATSSIQRVSPGWVDLSDELAYDSSLAISYLEDSGWTEIGADGIRVKGDERLSLVGLISPNINTSAAIMELVAQQLKAIGFELTLQTGDMTTYTTLTNDPATPLYITANSFLDATTLRNYWGEGFSNQFQLHSSPLEPLLQEVGRTTPGTPERTEAAAKVQEWTVDSALMVPLVDNYQIFVTSPKVHDVATNGVGRPYFFDTWKDA